MLAQCRFELRASGRKFGNRTGQLAKPLFGTGEHSFGGRDACFDFGTALAARGRFALERFAFGRQLRERRLGVRDQRLSASDVVGELNEPLSKLLDPLGDARFVAIKRFAGNHEAMQRRGGASLVVAQVRKCRCRARLPGRSLGLRAGALGHHPHRLILRDGGVRRFRLGVDEAEVEQRCFGRAHLL